MTNDLVDRLLAESAHLPPVLEQELETLRWAVLVEDVLGIVLSDEQMVLADLTDPVRLRALVARAADFT